MMETPQRTEEAPPKRKRGIGGWIVAAGAVVLKFLSQFKFLLIFLKTGGSMLVTMLLYAQVWGWPYAAGFVLLILVHECGHLIAARQVGLKVGAPVFIPFMGAFIALKEAPPDAWIEAWVGIGGPILGSIGALACVGLYQATGERIFLGLAYSGFFLNLFNLIPVSPLDGGRVTAAISPWLWLVGVAILGGLMVVQFNFLLLIIAILCAFRLMRLWKRRGENAAYFNVTPLRRWIMAVLYFGLAAFLAVGMQLVKHELSPQSAPEQISRRG